MLTERELWVEKLVESNDDKLSSFYRGAIGIYDSWLKAANGIRGKSLIEEHYNSILDPKQIPISDNLGSACEEDSGENY